VRRHVALNSVSIHFDTTAIHLLTALWFSEEVIEHFIDLDTFLTTEYILDTAFVLSLQQKYLQRQQSYVFHI